MDNIYQIKRKLNEEQQLVHMLDVHSSHVPFTINVMCDNGIPIQNVKANFGFVERLFD